MPPPYTVTVNVPLIHRLNEFYKIAYFLGSKIPKRDRFGIHLKIENISLELLELAIVAALEARENKKPLLNSMRIKTEVLKRLVRSMFELNIIERKVYIKLEAELQEISKMINGWIKYLQQERR